MDFEKKKIVEDTEGKSNEEMIYINCIKGCEVNFSEKKRCIEGLLQYSTWNYEIQQKGI